MPKLEIEKSIKIDAPAEKVFEIVSDLGKWRPWNPWLVTEPEAEVTVTDGGKAYSWKGKRTGEGSMTITHEKAPGEVDLDLVFLTPYKSESKVAFRIAPDGDGCRVSWSMDGSLPFFIFFLKKMMTALIGMDYDRGLSMLKDYVETGSVPSALEWVGEKGYSGCEYVGITNECAIADVGKLMSEDFQKLMAYSKETSTKPSHFPFTIYHDWNLTKGTCKYTSGIPVESLPSSVPDHMVTGAIPALKTYQIAHTGPYKHLGNAWSTGMQMSRQTKEIKQSKAHPPFELYMNIPGQVQDSDLLTNVCFPVK